MKRRTKGMKHEHKFAVVTDRNTYVVYAKSGQKALRAVVGEVKMLAGKVDVVKVN